MILLKQLNFLAINFQLEATSNVIIPLITAMLSFSGVILSIFIIIRTNRNQINNQNRQMNKPRLRPIKFLQANFEKSIDNVEYVVISKKAKNKTTEATCVIKFSLTLENIGYGIANNIKLFSLVDGVSCYPSISKDNSKNQILPSTEEIKNTANRTLNLSVTTVNNLNSDADEEDFCLFLCNYEDLNRNNYLVLIALVIKNIEKSDGTFDYDLNYDYYYYQEGTKEFDFMISNYKENYDKILNKLKKNIEF